MDNCCFTGISEPRANAFLIHEDSERVLGEAEGCRGWVVDHAHGNVGWSRGRAAAAIAPPVAGTAAAAAVDVMWISSSSSSSRSLIGSRRTNISSTRSKRGLPT